MQDQLTKVAIVGKPGEGRRGAELAILTKNMTIERDNRGSFHLCANPYLSGRTGHSPFYRSSFSIEQADHVIYALDRLANSANLEGQRKTAGNLKLFQFMLGSASAHAAGKVDHQMFRLKEVDRFCFERGSYGLSVLDSDFKEIHPLSLRQAEVLKSEVKEYYANHPRLSPEEPPPYSELNTLELRFRAAREYARRGWHVIPLHTMNDRGRCSCGEHPCRRYFHPRIEYWHDEASTNEATIFGWFEKWPDMNLGIVTGRKSNLVVVETYSTGNGGPQGHCSLGSFERAWLPLPETLKQSSCPDGQSDDELSHHFFQYPDTHQINSCEIQLGFDVIATSGYVLAPPCRFRKGPHLRWELPAGENAYLLSAKHPDPAPIPEWLNWLIQESMGETGGRFLSTGRNPETWFQQTGGMPVSLPTQVSNT